MTKHQQNQKSEATLVYNATLQALGAFEGPVRTGEIVKAITDDTMVSLAGEVKQVFGGDMDSAKRAVSVAAKRLRNDGMVDMGRGRPVSLTKKGDKAAKAAIRGEVVELAPEKRADAKRQRRNLWVETCLEAVRAGNGEPVALQDVYEFVKTRAATDPEIKLVAEWQPTIRNTMQKTRYFEKADRGTYVLASSPMGRELAVIRKKEEAKAQSGKGKSAPKKAAAKKPASKKAASKKPAVRVKSPKSPLSKEKVMLDVADSMEKGSKKLREAARA